MNTKDDGGPAFPRPASENTSGGTLSDGNYVEGAQDGMTLRDYFAAKAMQALISARCYPWDNQAPAYAYQIADAMLEARK